MQTLIKCSIMLNYNAALHLGLHCLLTTYLGGFWYTNQGLHRLEKYLNLEGFLDKSLKIKYALKSTGKSLKGLEKSLNSTFCRT